MTRLVLRNFRIIDAVTDTCGSVVVEDGVIKKVLPQNSFSIMEKMEKDEKNLEAEIVIDGGDREGPGPALMPAFVDLHAHFRDPGFPEKETLESASLAALAGGYGTVVCMANTRPPLDRAEEAAALKARSDRLGLIDLYPVICLSAGMEGRELSGLSALPDPRYTPPLLSEDGKDIAGDGLFLAALAEARRLGIPVSCHCDFGGPEAEAAKKAGQSRDIWSRIEENNAVARVLALGQKAGAPLHIAHVSTREAAELIRRAKAGLRGASAPAGFSLTCEASPHHLALTAEDARRLGPETWGRVNPPLREEEDRRAVAAAVVDGTIDAIATDHAPHSAADKEAGAPGFIGLETAFAVCVKELVEPGLISLSALSALMSRNPAKILNLEDRGLIAPGLRADLVIVDPRRSWTAEPGSFKSRGPNSPFFGQRLSGKVLMTIRRGRIVFQGK